MSMQVRQAPGLRLQSFLKLGLILLPGIANKQRCNGKVMSNQQWPGDHRKQDGGQHDLPKLYANHIESERNRQHCKTELAAYGQQYARAPGSELVDTGFVRSEEHTSELQSLMRISYAVFCLKKKIQKHTRTTTTTIQTTPKKY